MKFEYDPKKSQTNVDKHGISFEQAQMLWVQPYVEIPAFSEEETRFLLIGQLDGKCYSCIFTYRGQNIRLISARRSRKKEEEIYYAIIKKSSYH
jgi:uncharacterized DUF497 family protein